MHEELELSLDNGGGTISLEYINNKVNEWFEPVNLKNKAS